MRLVIGALFSLPSCSSSGEEALDLLFDNLVTELPWFQSCCSAQPTCDVPSRRSGRRFRMAVFLCSFNSVFPNFAITLIFIQKCFTGTPTKRGGRQSTRAYYQAVLWLVSSSYSTLFALMPSIPMATLPFTWRPSRATQDRY